MAPKAVPIFGIATVTRQENICFAILTLVS